MPSCRYCSKVSIQVSKFPDHWQVARLANVANVTFSNVDKLTSDDEVSVRLCNYVDVYKHDRITADIDFMEASAEPREIERFQIQVGDVLVTKDSETPDDIAIGSVVTDELPNVLCGYHLAMIRPCAHKLHGQYLAWLYASKQFRSHYEAHAVGVTRFGLAQSIFKATKLSLPTLEEQKAIAAHLEVSCSAIDLAITAKRKQIESLTGVRTSLLQRVVTRGVDQDPVLVETGNSWLQKIPKGWSLVMLKRLAEIQSGLTLGKVYEDQEVLEYPYLRVANVQDSYVDLEDVSTLEVPPAFAVGVMLRAGDVLMTEGGDLDKLGRGTVWAGQIEPCLHQNHVFAVRCYRHKLQPHFLAYVTAAQYGRDYFEATGKRTTNLAATNSTKVGMFYIPLPPLEEQRELVRYLDTELVRLAAIEANIGKQIDTLLAYRKSLIHECVTGKRRITSADFSESAAHA